MSSPIERFEDILKSKDAEIERLRVEQAEYEEEIESLNDHVAVLESDDHEWYLQAKRIEKLEAALRWIDDEAYSLDAAEYCAREAIAEVSE